MPSPGFVPSEGQVSGGSYVSPGGVYVSGESTVPNGAVIQEFQTGPIEGQTQTTHRPFVSSSAVESMNQDSVISVPGPEMGPIPTH